jgi:pimeloyl-ACP methyl ester carboxylesterase
VRGEFIDVGGVRLYYYAAGTRGAGEPVILLHGFPTSGHLWSDLVPLLPRGHRVVVVDLLGFGRSDQPRMADLSLRGHAGRLITFMDALGIRAAALVGHHFGGAVCQAAAVHWPERVTRLALVNSMAAGVTITGTFALMRAFRPLMRFVPTGLVLRAAQTDLLHRYVAQDYGRRSVEQYLRPFGSPEGRHLFVRQLAAMSERESAELFAALSRLSIPVAIVWGAHDAFAPPDLARRLRAAVPHATLDIIDNVRHFTPEEAPERVAAIVEGLLRR